MKNKIILTSGDPNSVNSEIIYKTWRKLNKSLRKIITYPVRSKVKSLIAAINAPPTMPRTEYKTGVGTSFFKTIISPIIVNRMLNLRKAVNIGKFKA